MTLQHLPKKRIVLLTDCLADLAGGAEKQIYELAKGLDKNQYNVYVVSLDCWGQAPKEIIEATGSQLNIFRVIRIYGLSGILQGFRFFKFLKDNQIDILLTYHFSSDIWGTFWGHLAGVKIIISNRRDMGFWRNNLHITAYKLMNRWVNKIVTVSESIKQMVIQEEGVESQRIEVIYNGVELPNKYNKNSEELRKQLGLKNNDTAIMHVANLKPVKGHKYLIEAFASISSQYLNVKLILIGRDELNGQLQDMTQNLNILDNVLFLGKRENISDLLKLADICVLPSLSEGMSNSILEYMAAQKPVIATKVGGNPELIKDGTNGILVEKENVQQLKDALLLLINDQKIRLDMGHAGYELVKNEFSMQTMLQKYNRLFSGIKVLHLISSGGMFGAERVILNLANKSEGITSFIGALNNEHNPHLEIIKEAQKLNLNSVIFNSRGKFDFSTIFAVKEFILNNKIDIIHTHNYKSDFIGASASKLTGIKWVATHHGWGGEEKKLMLYEKLDSFILKYAEKIVLVSSSMKQYFLNKNLNENRLEIIDNGIPIEEFDRLTQNATIKSSLGILPQNYTIMMVGRLSQEKGHKIFLKAAIEVIQKFQNIKFVIVGDGPLKENLQKQVLELNLSKHVLFTGILEDMPAVYAAGDIMVNASFTEGMPMTILEAMASRLPVIATNVGNVGKVIIDGITGRLLEPGDIHTLAKAILDLIQNKEKCLLFSENAYQKVTIHYSDTIMSQRYTQIYRDILSK